MKREVIIFFVILLVALSGWYWNTNIYSRETLKLEILGPDKVDIAENFEYLVKFKNNGKVRLEEPRLIFEYPEYSIVDEDLLRKEIELEDIYPGEERTHFFKARLIGKENQSRTAKATLSYKPKNLKARFESNTTLTTIIESVPLTFRFDLSSEIESGKDLKFDLNYFSNIDYPLTNLRVKIEYPLDFEFISSKPQSLEKVEWDVPPLNKAEGGRVEIQGRLNGEVGEQKVFKAELGTWQNGEFILLKEVNKGVQMIKPALYITQQINGSYDYVASPGDLLHYEISFKNIGATSLTDLSLLLSLDGNQFDFSSVNAPSAIYKSGDNSILWEWKKVGSLQYLDIKEEGLVEFWVQLKDDWDISSSKGEGVIKSNIYLSQANEVFENKVNSKLIVIQKGFYQDEIFGNSGYIPPKVNENTTYTIIWQAKNYYNNVSDVVVRAKLPNNVRLTGEIFPSEESEKFTFDSNSREIIWRIGEMMVGRGILNSAPNIAFQVSLFPSLNQKGKLPIVIESAEIIAEDNWTKETIRATSDGINTSLPDDPSVTEEMGIVQ
ncbi:MAG: hypothetical protein ABH967_02515 [Patescibacteria group bacterium]